MIDRISFFLNTGCWWMEEDIVHHGALLWYQSPRLWVLTARSALLRPSMKQLLSFDTMHTCHGDDRSCDPGDLCGWRGWSSIVWKDCVDVKCGLVRRCSRRRLGMEGGRGRLRDEDGLVLAYVMKTGCRRSLLLGPHSGKSNATIKGAIGGHFDGVYAS